jgi:hypothetical protein
LAVCAALLGLVLLGSARVAAAASGTPPVLVSAPVISGAPHKGSTLTCSTGGWEGNPTTFAWQWSRDGVVVEGSIAPTHTVSGIDVDSALTCAVTATNEFGSTTASSSEIAIVRIAVSIVRRTPRRQELPTIRFEGRLVTTLPPTAGVLELIQKRGGHVVRVARARPARSGHFLFTVTTWAMLPGRYASAVRFVPYDPELYEAAAMPVRVMVVSPPTYPFSRSPFERRATLFDHLVPFWSDGQSCSIGCRPGGSGGWPLRPFHEQHPIRAGINERRESGFHLGIDIQAAGMTHVYAVQSGRAHIIQAHGLDARVQIGSFIYWHVRGLSMYEGEFIPAYRRAIGIVMPNVRHLHLSEVDGSGRYLNPLRPHGRLLAPWADNEPPVIGRPQVSGDGRVLVSAFDPQSYVTMTAYETPVLAPAALAYRLFESNGTPIGPLQWALRGSHVLPKDLEDAVFTADAHSPGYLCFAFRVICVPHWRYHLAGGLAPRLPALGRRYRMTVYAWDWAGNTTARDMWLSR